MTLEIWLGYAAAALLLTMLPGLDTALVLRTAASSGPRPGVMAALGIGLGCLCWGIMSALGLGALLAACPAALAALRLLGAGYIAWLGLAMLLRPSQGLAVAAGGASEPGVSGRAFRRGLVTNLLNPKVGAFYVTLIPQFVPAGPDTTAISMELAAVHVALAVVWFAMLARMAGAVTPLLRRRPVATMVDRATGAILIGFGANLALAT
jgi:threonine/homoserine/homoserine lactone efflux protein